MISASHNHFSDNGIKIFNRDGLKLTDEEEKEIEEIKEGLDNSDSSSLNSYIEKIKKSFSFDKQNSKKIKIVIDSSNNINESCSVTNPNVITNATIKNKADIWIAFDGDGDHILAIFAESFGLENSKILSTIMSNFGFE